MTSKTKTLKVACKEFVEHLKATGTAEITANNYWRILGLFIDYLGENKSIADITVRNVSDFYRSKPATLKTMRDGSQKPRAESSYMQIRRDVRLALCWFSEQGWIDSIPLPPDERRFIDARNDNKKPKKSGKKTDDKNEAEGAKAKAKAVSDKTMKTCGTDGVQPIKCPVSENPINAIGEPVKAKGVADDTIGESNADEGKKLRLL